MENNRELFTIHNSVLFHIYIYICMYIHIHIFLKQAFHNKALKMIFKNI